MDSSSSENRIIFSISSTRKPHPQKMAIFTDDEEEDAGIPPTINAVMEVDSDPAQESHLREQGSRLAEAGDFAVGFGLIFIIAIVFNF